MLDYGIFYEFVPITELGSPSPRRLNIAEVRVGEPYAVLLTTPAGLWSYVLGDTVRFVSLDPPQLVITGRTGHFVNAFGENVIVEEVERAAVAACARTQAELVEFTVAPVYPREPRATPPATSGPSSFAPARRASTGSRTPSTRRFRRSTRTTGRSALGNVGMAPPRVTAVATGSFHRWLAAGASSATSTRCPGRATSGTSSRRSWRRLAPRSRTASRFRADRLAQATPLTSVRYVISRLIRL